MTDAPRAPLADRIIHTHLFGPGTDLDSLPWQPFRPGVEIVSIYGSPAEGPSAAFLRYQAGATMPTHFHTGYEHILVLRSSQQDENHTIEVGTLMINPPGSSHTVTAAAGCVVLIIWEKPVSFIP